MIILPMPMYTTSTGGGGVNISNWVIAAMYTILDVALIGLMVLVGYMIPSMGDYGFISIICAIVLDSLILALLILAISITVDTYKDIANEIKCKRNEKVRTSLNTYGDFVKPTKGTSVDSYVNSLFKKEKKNERK